MDYEPTPTSTPKPKTSGAAIASLVFGLLGCIPGPGLVAFILGIVGIRKTGNPMVKGRGMAIAGLILGVLSIAVWGVFGAGAIAVVMTNQAAEPARVVAEEFTRDLIEGKIDEALTLAVAGTDRAALEAASAKLKPAGTLTNLQLVVAIKDGSNGKSDYVLNAVANFPGGARSSAITMTKVGEAYKVSKFDYP